MGTHEKMSEMSNLNRNAKCIRDSQKRVACSKDGWIYQSMIPILCSILALVVSCSNPKMEQGGTRHFSFNYSEGHNHADGEWYFFNNFANLDEIGSYTNNLRVGKWKSFHSNGILSSIGEYRTWMEDSIDRTYQSSTIQDSLTAQGAKIRVVDDQGFSPFDASNAAFISELPNGEKVTAVGLWVFFDTNSLKLYEVMYDDGRELWRR
jgi:hypothetical protein